MTSHFVDVTEIEGQQISVEQLGRICHRYHWAERQCEGKDVLEVACGAGQGLAILKRSARTVTAGDHSPEVLQSAINNFGDMNLSVFSAESLPFKDNSFDRIVLFEAIYYIDHVCFLSEAKRVLRPGGALLIATANKDLYDFTPSPYTKRYLGAAELAEELMARGFEVALEGYLDTSQVGLRQSVLRPLKALASRLGIMPRTMRGKKLLKRLFFGALTSMPVDLAKLEFEYVSPIPIKPRPNRRYKVLYCRADLLEKG